MQTVLKQKAKLPLKGGLAFLLGFIALDCGLFLRNTN